MSPVRQTALSHEDIAALVQRREVGHSLEAPFYSNPEIYDLDLDAIFARHWLFCAAEAEIPEPGDYITVDIGPHSVIAVRDDDGSVSAVRNVCRHRGARILDEPCGVVANLVCPYHRWTYRPDGTLLFAEGQTIDKSRFGLARVHVRTLAGLIFLHLSDDPPTDFDEVAARIEPFLAPYCLADAKVAYQSDLAEEGNWKLVMENNRECQHCDAGHPELVDAYFPLLRYSEDDLTPRTRAVFERYQAAEGRLHASCVRTGMPQGRLRELDTRPSGFQLIHLPLDGDGSSFGPHGAQLNRRLMGRMSIAEFGDLSLHFQPNSWFHLLSDHAVVFRALPVSPTRTLVRSTWLVHADAVAGVDYDVDSLTAVWRATNDQDRALVERTQRGVTDPGYVPGPYASVEDDVEALVSWYVRRIREHLGLGQDPTLARLPSARAGQAI